MALEGKVLVELLAGSDCDRMVIDGAGPEPRAITRSAARKLIGAASYSIPGGSTFLIGQPAQTPPEGLVGLRE